MHDHLDGDSQEHHITASDVVAFAGCMDGFDDKSTLTSDGSTRLQLQCTHMMLHSAETAGDRKDDDGAGDGSATHVPLDPPFRGTVWLCGDKLIPPDAPTAFAGLRRRGIGPRLMFDRRRQEAGDAGGGWVESEPWLFDVWLGTRSIEVQVNREFDCKEVEDLSGRFGRSIGRLPAAVLRDVDTVWVHRGDCGFGGGNRNILIHTDMAERYMAEGVLEAALLHEASHTSLDGDHANAPEWLQAAAADPVAVSTYARDNPHREDIAESVGPFLAATYRSDFVPRETVAAVRRAIPNRLAYLASHTTLTMEPLACGTVRGMCGCGATKFCAGPGPDDGMWGIFVCHCSVCPHGQKGTAWCAVPRCTFSGPSLSMQRTTSFAQRGSCSECGEAVLVRYDGERCTDWVSLATIRDGAPGLPWSPGRSLPPMKRRCHVEVPEGRVVEEAWGDGLAVYRHRAMAYVVVSYSANRPNTTLTHTYHLLQSLYGSTTAVHALTSSTSTPFQCWRSFYQGFFSVAYPLEYCLKCACSCTVFVVLTSEIQLGPTNLPQQKFTNYLFTQRTHADSFPMRVHRLDGQSQSVTSVFSTSPSARALVGLYLHGHTPSQHGEWHHVTSICPQRSTMQPPLFATVLRRMHSRKPRRPFS